MESPGIYFFLIPKTAGSSLTHFLNQAFPANEICPWWLWDQLITIPRSGLEKWRVFRGHFLSHLEPYLGKRLTTFTVLRDPVNRTISHYLHVRRAPEHPSHSHAQRLSLAEFCVHPETRHMVENYQANYLAKSPCDPVVLAQDLSPEQLSKFELQERLQYPDRFPDFEALLARAQTRLATFDIVGLTENFADAVLEIGRQLNCPAVPMSERRNVNPEPLSPADLDRSTLSLIYDLTEVDQCLYRSVSLYQRKRQLSTRYASVGVPRFS